MKRIIFSLIIFLLASVSVFAQERHGRDNSEALVKAHKMEKLRMIEFLNMDETTTLKFFARRGEVLKRIRALDTEKDSILASLQRDFADKGGQKKVYGPRIDRLSKIESEMLAERNGFVLSLKDIFTDEQIAKFVALDKKIRNELRDIIRHNMPPAPPEKDKE